MTPDLREMADELAKKLRQNQSLIDAGATPEGRKMVMEILTRIYNETPLFSVPDEYIKSPKKWHRLVDIYLNADLGSDEFYFDQKKGIRNIEYYINRAYYVQGIQSDRELSVMLKKAPNFIHSLITKKSKPSPESIVNIAKMGLADSEIAIIESNIWKANGRSRIVLESILNKLEGLKKPAAELVAIAVLSLPMVVMQGNKPPENEVYKLLKDNESKISHIYII